MYLVHKTLIKTAFLTKKMFAQRYPVSKNSRDVLIPMVMVFQTTKMLVQKKQELQS